MTAYRRDLLAFQNFITQQDLDFTQISRQSLEHFAEQRLEAQRLSNASFQRELSAVKGFYRWLNERHEIYCPAAEQFRVKRAHRRLPEILDQETVLHFLTGAGVPVLSRPRDLYWRDQAMFELLYDSGYRGEFCYPDYRA